MLSAVALAGVVGWDIHRERTARDTYVALVTASTSTTDDASTTVLFDPVSTASAGALYELQGAVESLLSNGSYSSTTIAQIAQQIGQSTRTQITYHGYSSSDIRTDTDTSAARVLTYRKDMQTAEKPLLQNKQYELDLLREYSETKDTKYVDQMHAAAQIGRAHV